MKILTFLTVVAVLSAQPAPPRDDLELYYLIFLRPAADRKPLEKAEGDRIQSAHMANIRKMAQDGILKAAGPMEGSPGISGIFLFKTGSLEEARRIAAQDPTVIEKRNTVDVHQWWGPKGIGAPYFEWRKTHPDAPEEMISRQFCILKKGPAWNTASTLDVSFIDRERRQGRLEAAGPFEEDTNFAGLYIFRLPSIEEAQKLIDQDPAVKTGRFRAEFHVWWSAARVFPDARQ